MRDNLITLGYKVQHPLKYRVISFIAYIVTLPLTLILVTFIGYKTFENEIIKGFNEL